MATAFKIVTLISGVMDIVGKGIDIHTQISSKSHRSHRRRRH